MKKFIEIGAMYAATIFLGVGVIVTYVKILWPCCDE